MAVGVYVKETIVILLPVFWMFLLIQQIPFRRQLLLMGSALGVVLLNYLLVRILSPVQTTLMIWAPSLDRLLANASRWQSWGSFALTFGIPGCLAVAALLDRKHRIIGNRLMVPFGVGLGVSLALFGFATISAYADGRFIWTSYPFTIPLAIYWLDKRSTVDD
jgi:hypothetical protein